MRNIALFCSSIFKYYRSVLIFDIKYIYRVCRQVGKRTLVPSKTKSIFFLSIKILHTKDSVVLYVNIFIVNENFIYLLQNICF